jgi:hypothetical protein
LQRQRVVHDLAEGQRQCPQCQGDLKRIGEEVSERLEYVPASLVVIQEACQKYACPKGCTVVTAEKPMAPIEKGLPGPGLLAQVAVGRKNWMFYGSDNGGRTAAVLSSLIATSKRLGVDPFAYLRDLFERLSAHPKSRWAELLPDQWKVMHPPSSTC